MRKRFLVEIKTKTETFEALAVGKIGMALEGKGRFRPEVDYAIPVESIKETREELGPATAIIRGIAEEDEIERLRSQSDVFQVWEDTQFAPIEEVTAVFPLMVAGRGCPPYDCTNVATGTWKDAAKHLKAPEVWNEGFKGQKVVIGIADGGIDKTHFPGKVLDGWTADGSPWGINPAWDRHGCMCSFDALAIAPEAKLHDIAIGKSTSPIGGFISDALKGYQWALDHFQKDKTPQIVSGSWGYYQKAWDQFYTTNPNHPFTRKVAEMVRKGMIITFAAGNCGDGCSWQDYRCGADTGSGRSIWGANGSPPVITVAGVNTKDELAGYSSVGPAALDKKKPDVCGITHFQGYYDKYPPPSGPRRDSGTSAANPTVAGVAALLKSAKPNATPEEVKNCLLKTARNICSPGWDIHSGYGVVDAKAALACLVPLPPDIKGLLKEIKREIMMIEDKLDKLLKK